MRVLRFNAPILRVVTVICCVVAVVAATGQQASAITPLPTPAPQPNSYGIEATKRQPPPTVPATVTTPASGSSFSTSPITVSGICQAGLLVQVFNNGVMVGAIDCKNGSFSLQVSLFRGINEITASVFDDLDQAGPPSNVATVTYNDPAFEAFGTVITLTSTYGRRAANPDTMLKWPLQLSGGVGPYAFSIDWGDGTPPELKSQGIAGEIIIQHTYKRAGVYHVTVKATDVNGVSAFIQLVAVANGKVSAAATQAAETKTVMVNRVLWLPVALAFAMLFPTYWFGRRSQLITLHKRLEKSVNEYKEL